MVTLREELRAETAPSEPSDGGARSRGRGSSRPRSATSARTTPSGSRRRSTTSCRRSSPRSARSAAARLAKRHYDVQLIGGMVLHQGNIAEMKTGEGKTLVAPLAAALNAHDRPRRARGHGQRLPGQARRAVDGPIFHGLGLTVGIIQHEAAYVFDPDSPRTDESLPDLRPVSAPRPTPPTSPTAPTTSSASTTCATTWSSSSTSGSSAAAPSRIVDEVDNILIDEARTPLIISGQAEESADMYYQFARLVPRLKERPRARGGDYFVDLKEHAVSPTEEGIDKIETLARRRQPVRQPTRGWPATSSRRSAPRRSTSAIATTSSRTARSSSSTSSPVA